MTTATNAVIQRRGAKTAFVTTRGFRDLLLIGRQDRPSLYDIDIVRTPPLVPRELCYGIGGRLDAEGREIEPLARGELAEAAADMRAKGVEAVAVVFLHAYANPAHEREAKAVLEQQLPGVVVSISTDILARVPRVRARQHDGPQRLPDAGHGRVPRRAIGPAARTRHRPRHRARQADHGDGGLRRVDDRGVGAGASGPHRPVGAGGRRRRRRALRGPGRGRHHHHHGHRRHQHRHQPDSQRPARDDAQCQDRPDPDPPPRHRHQRHRRGRRLDRLDRRRRGAARRPGQRRSRAGARLLRPGRHAADRHGRQSRARPARRRHAARPAI